MKAGQLPRGTAYGNKDSSEVRALEDGGLQPSYSGKHTPQISPSLPTFPVPRLVLPEMTVEEMPTSEGFLPKYDAG